MDRSGGDINDDLCCCFSATGSPWSLASASRAATSRLTARDSSPPSASWSTASGY